VTGDSSSRGDMPGNCAIADETTLDLSSCQLSLVCGQLAPGRGVLLQFRRPLVPAEFKAINASLAPHVDRPPDRAFGAPRPDLLYLADAHLAAPDPNRHLWLAQRAAAARARLTGQPESCRLLQIIDTNDLRIRARPARWQRVTGEGEPLFDVGRYTYSLGDVANEFLCGYPLDHDVEHEPNDIADALAGLSPTEAEELVEYARSRLHLVDADGGIDETSLLCRAAVAIIAARPRRR
jgi:hypothetical protein